MTRWTEINFDGLVSPAHNYSGLALGNLASTRSEGMISRPREAARQGLAKMRFLASRGVAQAFLPPQVRPSVAALRRLGFRGDDAGVLRTALEEAPHWFAACASSSSMWTANAATVAPSTDTADGRVHLTPANLLTNFHRSIETPETAATLKSIFSSGDHFIHHDPLPSSPCFSDEGAANHIRLVRRNGRGLHLFVHGRAAAEKETGLRRFPARQTLEACEAVARLHRISPEDVLFLRQHPEAIDAGVFHNDVISVGHENLLLFHEMAFAGGEEVIRSIREAFSDELHLIEVPASAITLDQCVSSYLFNSQIVTLPDGGMLLLSPLECREIDPVRRFIEEKIIPGENPIGEVVYQDLRQSMRNGGGPACLRLRVTLSDEERATLPPRVLFSEETEAFLDGWIDRHYPEELALADLASPDRYTAVRAAIEELRGWMGLPA